MTSLFEALAEVGTDLDQLGVRWALIGGLAVSVRAEPRTTKDLDVAIAVTDDPQAEGVIRDLMARSYRMLHEPLERTDQDRMSTVRMIALLRQGEMIVDLLFASSGIEPEIVAAAEPVEVLPGVTLPVIAMGHLLAVKSHAARLKDLADLQSLLRVASTRDLQTAREALDLIARRVAVGDRDLQAEFEDHVENFSGS